MTRKNELIADAVEAMQQQEGGLLPPSLAARLYRRIEARARSESPDVAEVARTLAEQAERDAAAPEFEYPAPGSARLARPSGDPAVTFVVRVALKPSLYADGVTDEDADEVACRVEDAVVDHVRGARGAAVLRVAAPVGDEERWRRVEAALRKLGVTTAPVLEALTLTLEDYERILHIEESS